MTADRLQRIVRLLDAGALRRLPRSDLRELPALYRRAASDLAEARARGLPREHLADLEGLLLRAHGVIYAPAPLRFGRTLADLVSAFPAAVRRSSRHIAVAAALLVSGCSLGLVEVRRDPSSAAVLLPGDLGRNAEESFQAGAKPREGDPIYGVFYFTNNARVALNGYALGATFGVGTVLVLLFNGVVLGATFAIVGSLGSPRAFFAFVLPHGGVELSAIVIAAAGGLKIADGLLRPGFLPRRQSLVQAARSSLPLALGSAFLLAVAGLVEGWISPLQLAFGWKVAVGAVLDLLLLGYLLLTRRKGQPVS